MTVARITKITSSSQNSFQDAVDDGLERANKTLRGITGIDVISHTAKVKDGKVKEYRVTMNVAFVLDDD